MLDFIHIPKTAGVSICKAIGQQHGHRPRPIKPGAFVFSCVRNPYDRAVSLYYFLRDKAPNYREAFLIDGETVNTFWQERIHVIRQHRFTQPQAKWLDGIKVDRLLRFENLAGEWQKMRDEFELPELESENVNEFRPAIQWQDELSAESIAKIGELYAEDFEHLNYERIG